MGEDSVDEHSLSDRSSDFNRWIREVAVVAMGAGIYFIGRLLVEGSETRATTNAQRLLDLEHTLGLDIERDVQAVALDHRLIEAVGDFTYVWFHWPLIVIGMVYLFHRSPVGYRRLRNAFFVSGAIGLVLFALVPMAPPRFMPDHVGTVSDDARRLYLDIPMSWLNRYAAFPSFHVGWTIITCSAVAPHMRRQGLRVAVLVPAVLMVFAVVSTGNHYILDSATGAAIAIAAYSLLPHSRRPSGSILRQVHVPARSDANTTQ